MQVPFGRAGSSRGLTHVSFFLLWALSFFLFSFKPVLVGGEGEISFQFPPPLLQSRAALGEREALKHSGQADFSGYSPPPPTPAPPPHDWGWGWRAALVPTPPAETWAGGTQKRRWKRKKKRAPGMAKSSPFSPPESRTPTGCLSFKRGFPRRAAPSPRRPRHTRCAEARWLCGPAAGRPAPRARRGSHTPWRLRPGRGAAAGPAGCPELFMGGVLYSLTQTGAAVQCYLRALRSPPPPLRLSLALSPCSAYDHISFVISPLRMVFY